MKKLTEQNKRHLANRSRAQIKKNIKANKAKKSRNRRFNKIKSGYRKQIKEVEHARSYIAPEVFVLRENANQVLEYIEGVKNHRNTSVPVYVNLSKVTKITHGAIAMLLSVVKEISKNKVKVLGNKPRDKEAKKVLEASGFFNHVRGSIDSDNYKSINTIVTKGRNNVEPEITASLVQDAMEFITGTRSRNQPIQGMLIELMANSINHAFPNKLNKEWVLALNYDETNKLTSFSFVDNGVGIIDTLKLNLMQRAINLFKGNDDLLISAFKGEIGSRTGLNYRGRGLPSILKKFNNNNFSNLVVVTNNVLLDFANEKFVVLKSSFKGTYYYWELKINNISK